MIGSTISRRYAKALLSIGQEDGRYQEYGQNLQEFTDFCLEQGEFFTVISSRVFPGEDRKKVLDALLDKSDFAGVVKNFLRLLLDKNRIGAVEAISEYHARLTDELSNITRADVITAKPLKGEAERRLAEVLKGFSSKEVKMSITEDSALIGGLVVKIGDLVLDGSVRAQLEGLRESLKRGGYS